MRGSATVWRRGPVFRMPSACSGKADLQGAYAEAWSSWMPLRMQLSGIVRLLDGIDRGEDATRRNPPRRFLILLSAVTGNKPTCAHSGTITTAFSRRGLGRGVGDSGPIDQLNSSLFPFQVFLLGGDRLAQGPDMPSEQVRSIAERVGEVVGWLPSGLDEDG